MKNLFIRIVTIFTVITGGLLIHQHTASASQIDPDTTYSYEKMTKDIKALAERYPDAITYQSIGTSTYGKEIWAVKVGKGEKNILVNGSHHAREWLTSTLNMKMVETYANAYSNRTTVNGFQVRPLLNDVAIWFVPMVNPDGVTLQQQGLSGMPSSIHDDLINMNGGSDNFTRWKANAKGEDINRQYPADWENIKYNSGKPSYKNFKGYYPMQAIEARHLADFTYETGPRSTVAYHSAGQIVYWYFSQTGDTYDRDKRVAENISQITGYQPVAPQPNPSGGGYTDWFVDEFKRVGLTIEIGAYPGERHLPTSAFDQAWTRNKIVPLRMAQNAR
ncbi:M14 family zinc carboxypeptidase [Thalassobacillus hwangdonensis]|uniref:M14 family zinc carboxypeptidase n=1 Tax=Thalassobacillus hwangdonensis TaxID=546108 RepID=A0ABW3L4L9_9BACI